MPWDIESIWPKERRFQWVSQILPASFHVLYTFLLLFMLTLLCSFVLIHIINPNSTNPLTSNVKDAADWRALPVSRCNPASSWRWETQVATICWINANKNNKCLLLLLLNKAFLQDFLQKVKCMNNNYWPKPEWLRGFKKKDFWFIYVAINKLVKEDDICFRMLWLKSIFK